MSSKGGSSSSGHPQPPWRGSSASGSQGHEGSDRLQHNQGGPQPPPRQSSASPHQHHHHQQHHQHRERVEKDRDREKNHETVCNLLSMLTLGTDQTQTQEASSSSSAALDQNRMLLLNLTNSPESCIVLRRAGCIPLLIEILHPPSSPPLGMRPPEIIKTRASRALKNIVQFNPDEKLKRKELRVLKLLEGIRAFSEAVKIVLQAMGKDFKEEAVEDPVVQEKLRQTKQHPTQNMTTLMKLSFDEEHRNTMCLLGAIHALADLIMCDHLLHGNSAPETKEDCFLIRRYSGMTLTNLTFGDGTNKALLCGMKSFMDALVSQLECENEDVCQVTASVLRNLSWHADSSSRASLRDSNAVPKLTLAAIKSTKESTLKATLSALWNLSAHSVANKSAICTASPDSLPFLISLLRPNNPLLKTLKTPMTIIENAGGILRNISSQICTSPEHRKVLRENHCYEILLEHLKSCSLTVVSNACGTLWNLSGGVGCEEDQRKLLDLNAVPMLKNLIYSKHERISQGASAALRNLLSSRFAKEHMLQLDSRLTAHIYSSNPPQGALQGGEHHHRNILETNQESPGSDGDFDFDFQHHHQYPQTSQQIIHHPPAPPVEVTQQHSEMQPPMAHQHSSAAVVSIFHRRQQPTPPPPPTHFIAPPPTSFPHPGNYMSRPTSINYSMEPEPLDLTLTSAKSSPIHIISAAEFGGMTHHHHSLHHSHPHHNNHSPRGKPKPPFNTLQTQFPSGTNANGAQNPKPFFNPPALLHQTGTASQCSSPMRFNYPGQKFNRSCPEILSRLNSSHNHNAYVPEPKPLDFSSNSHSASSSLRGGGGAGEATGHNDSQSGGDTTFNYSLQFTEVDDDDRQNTTGNGENVSKSEDTLKTYCYEGTPHNFSISNSCQDLVHEIEMENKAAAAETATTEKPAATGNANAKSQKLQPIDETPKSYYVENTPAVFSRTSSLSSINSSGGLNAGENKAELPHDSEDKKSSVGAASGPMLLHSPQPILHPVPKQRKSGPHHGTFTPGRVTFSAEETPLMFSRCSSVASLDSLDVPGAGGGNGMAAHNDDNDDNLSDFSRRASEVVSPSDLPDSPRAMAPPVRIYDVPPPVKQEKREEGEDDVKVFTMEEKSGLNSCRSLSPLMIDDEVLPILGKRKLEDDQSMNMNGAKNGMEPVQLDKDSVKHPEGDCKKKPNAFPDDEVKIFAMEGTPFYGVSNATSLSDLTMDFDGPDGPGMQQPLPPAQKPLDMSKPSLPVLKEGETSDSGPVEEAGHSHGQSEPNIPGTNSIVPPPQNQTASKEEPIYSDVQLLQKCIRIGKTVGIPKSKSEYKITKSESTEQVSSAGNISGSSNNITGKKPLTESKSQHDFDDPDLAALIMKGRNRPKEKEKAKSGKASTVKTQEKEKATPPSSESENSKSIPTATNTTSSSNGTEEGLRKAEDKKVEPEATSDEVSSPEKKTELKPDTLALDPSQISTTSLGSEWNDETPTFSSPIPSMSISTAFKIVGGPGVGDQDDSSSSKPTPPLPQQQSSGASPPKPGIALKAGGVSMQSSLLTMSMMNNELLENIDPPSTFSNVISSSDCILPGSPPMNPKLIGSCSDKLSRKWKALNDTQNTSSIHSNLSGQRPPLDLYLENSMISVASIKSEIYELSSTASFTNDVFQSAMEDFGSPTQERAPGTGDHSLGCNTYTIFPPEMGENGKSADVISEGGNTVVSDDFTDAEEIEDFETAAEDNIVHVPAAAEKRDRDEMEKEKSDQGKPEVVDNATVKTVSTEPEDKPSPKSNLTFLQQHQMQHNQPKPLMEVHPLESSSNKYNTFKIQKPSMSPKSSPKQKRRDDPERYKTHTIAALNTGKSLLRQSSDIGSSKDTNGNPLNDDSRFATFRVGGPKILKPGQNANAHPDGTKTSQSNSPESTPGNSPKGIRGRRKPLYSSLPPSAIQAKKKQAPPIPPKPVRNASPVRPSSSASGGNVYVRPTRTSELRCAANSRDSSPSRDRVRSSSRSSSNSSLNNIAHNATSKIAELESTFGTSAFPGNRPKVAPKPPVRTSASSTTSSNKPFSGSSYNVVIKTSNSSFGFGQQKVGDAGQSQNMKGYSTLPKSSKLGGEFGGMYMPGSVPPSQIPNTNGESKESIPGSEKSLGKMNKLTSLFKRMDFHRKETQDTQTPFLEGNTAPVAPTRNDSEKKRFSFFGRKKDKEKQQKPFLDSNINSNTPPVSTTPPPNNHGLNTASISTRGPTGVWVRRDGENKAMVAPFNYVPPPNHPLSQKQAKEQTTASQNNANLPSETSHQVTNNSSTTSNTSSSSAAAAGSAKITTV